MVLHARFIAAALLVVSGLLPAAASPAPRGESEEDLLARLQRETNPVKKAKVEMQLARLKLLAAIDSNTRGDLDECLKLLGVYLERVKSSWETLRTSGRQATRQPQGFKELDIALREDARLLEDLKRRVPYSDREAVEKCALEVELVRGEVLRALFPPERPRGAGESFVPRKTPVESIAMLLP